jgi:flagellar M-ring protein FliF
MKLLTNLSTRGKITLGVSIFAVLIATVLLFKMATKPSYTQIQAGVNPAQITSITSALTTAGVAYEVQGNGTAIAVKSGQEGAAQVALANAGLGSAASTQPGMELMDKVKLGASNMQQQVTYQRALEGQIANTIGKINGIGGATVALTLPQDNLFTDNKQGATAAVMLQGDASTLDSGSVKGIASLVASSVQGLQPGKVTITDSSGNLLWPNSGSGGDSGALSKQAAQSQYNAQLGAQLDAMLASTLGAGKAHVQVNADLNVDQASQEQLQYAKKGVPLTTTTDDETLTSSGGGTSGGATGTATNVPSYASNAASGANGKSNYKHTTGTTNFGVDKTITKRTIAPGTVNRLDVALVIDKSVPPATVASLKNAVASAAGIQTKRGDTLAVSQIAFAKAPAATPAGGPVPAGMAKYAKGGLLGLAALLFFFFMTRALKKRQNGGFADEPSWLRGLDQVGLPRGEGATIDVEPIETAESVFKNDPRALALDEMVQREPEKVAHQLRSWLTEDAS